MAPHVTIRATNITANAHRATMAPIASWTLTNASPTAFAATEFALINRERTGVTVSQATRAHFVI